MRSKRKPPRKRATSRTVGRAKTRSVSKPADSALSRKLQDLHEQIDLVLPEVTARVAALEHLLLEKQLCTRADLIDARTFVRLQEA
jgi:Holliday junction resolvasome RuvABC endonuclease subunit